MLVGASISSLLIGKPSATTAANTYQTPQAFPVSITKPANVPPKFSSEVVLKPTELDIWLNKLAQKESNGRTHFRILDVNGWYSYGCLQFQMPTFQAYVRQFSLTDELGPGGFQEAIYDCNLQKRLAKLMILKDYDNWQHWYNSVMEGGIGLPPKQK